MLEKILVFNPYFRPTVQECLEHPYFKNIRNFEKEKPAEGEISLDIEKVGELNMDTLK